MHEELLAQIACWHDEGDHAQIIRAIENIPRGDWGYALTGKYAVALNNTRRYRQAMEALDSVREQGGADGAWHYRYAYAWYRLDEYQKAVDLLHRAIELGRDKDEGTLELLAECEGLLHRKRAKAETLARRAAERRMPDPDAEPFAGFDFTGFWDDDDYALREYVGAPPTDAQVREIETELGYKLPRSYLWLMKRHNGGMPSRTNHPAEDTTWSEDHIAVTGILGIGRDRPNSLGGEFGSRFWIEEWQYPDIGVAICDCPSAGHDMVFLDYRHCGVQGEPMVVHVDQERDYEITWLADDFESFVRGLVPDEDDDAQ